MNKTFKRVSVGESISPVKAPPGGIGYVLVFPKCKGESVSPVRAPPGGISYVLVFPKCKGESVSPVRTPPIGIGHVHSVVGRV